MIPREDILRYTLTRQSSSPRPRCVVCDLPADVRVSGGYLCAACAMPEISSDGPAK